MAPAHWLCAVRFGAHTQAVDVGVGNAVVWLHFASSRALVILLEKFVSKPVVSDFPITFQSIENQRCQYLRQLFPTLCNLLIA